MSIRRFLFGVRTVQLLSQISSSLGSPFFSVLLIPLMFHVFSLFLPPVFHSDKSDTAVPVLLPFFPVYGNGFLRCFYMQTFIFHRFHFPPIFPSSAHTVPHASDGFPYLKSGLLSYFLLYPKIPSATDKNEARLPKL